jgi:hypothetical protein
MTGPLSRRCTDAERVAGLPSAILIFACGSHGNTSPVDETGAIVEYGCNEDPQ